MGKKPIRQNTGAQFFEWDALQTAPPSVLSPEPSLEELVARNLVVQEAIRLFQARIVSVRRLGNDEIEGDISELTQLPLWSSPQAHHPLTGK